ncbi:polar localization protein TipN [Phenylobacterium sp.]|uniref:polar localization protein TipN n=1 Tax=Phenylobacterium sp. TaxID=1871053 RepID=UPI003D2DF5AD
MKFSKRPQPMDFGRPVEDAPNNDDHDAPLLDAEAVGFRRIDPAAEQSPALRPHRAELEAAADDAYAHAVEIEETPPAGWPIWLIATAVAVLWAAAPIAFAVGYRANIAPLQYDPFALGVFALLSIGPAAFVLLAAYMIRQAQKLAFEARRGRAMAEDMLSPALVAAARAGDVTQAVRDEIARAGAAAEEARETLLAMRDALAFETDKLTGATAQTVRTAGELAGTLGRERSEMSALAQTLDAQATKVADAITLQARMVTDATGVAEAQIREAEAALSARAADLAAAAGEASSAARTAGEDLTRHIARLETAGTGVTEQVRAVEAGLSEQRTALVALSQSLKTDQDVFAGEAEAHAAKLAAFIEEARTSAAEMGERASAGGEQLRRLMSDAALQFRDLAETAKAEREEFGQSTLQSLEAVSAAAAEQRAQLDAQTRAAIAALAKAADETREAAARHAAAAREQVDNLSEAAFGAGQKANQVFEARLEEARALIEESSKLVETAGQNTARKLEQGAASARAAMDELAAMLSDLEARARELPAAAAGQADQVRAIVADGMDELMAQARRTAQEAEAIDAAFQDRVRRNFQMLSEAVRIMGVAAAAPRPLRSRLWPPRRHPTSRLRPASHAAPPSRTWLFPSKSRASWPTASACATASASRPRRPTASFRLSSRPPRGRRRLRRRRVTMATSRRARPGPGKTFWRRWTAPTPTGSGWRKPWRANWPRWASTRRSSCRRDASKRSPPPCRPATSTGRGRWCASWRRPRPGGSPGDCSPTRTSAAAPRSTCVVSAP